jgi:Flp pilus assembly protein TadD
MPTVSEILQLAVSSHQAGRLAQAEELYRQALQLDPRQLDALHLLGVVSHQLGRSDRAIELLSEALRLKPDFAEAHGTLGIVLKRQGRLEEALASYRQALRLRPDLAETHNNVGILLKRLGRLDEAVASYREAVRYRPSYAEAYSNLGSALKEQNQLCEAAAVLGESLRLNPNSAEAHNNLGGVRKREGRLAEAAASFQQALRLKPDFAEAQSNLGATFRDQGKLDEAVAVLRQALNSKPEYAEAHTNLGMIWLLRGDFEQGFPEYEWRWKGQDLLVPHFPQPVWDGSRLEGRTILLHAEQGFGDTLQFIRYAPLVRERGGRVVVACSTALHRLLEGFPGVDQFVAPDALPSFDVYAPLLSLPGILGTTLATIPARTPYLCADPGLVEHWRQELQAEPGFKIGIVWQGNPQYAGDRCRSIPLEAWAPLARVEGVRLVSLQKGFGTEQIAAVANRFAVTDLGSRLDEAAGPFRETAAVMRNLDLVITVDTVAGHLAGGLGVPVWLALSYVPDWRWMLERDDSPWYPTARLFRQTAWGDWSDVCERMAGEVRKLLAAGRTQRGLG